MAIVTITKVQCDNCKITLEEQEGIKIQGNIYAINSDELNSGGLIRNNFIRDEQGQITEVKEQDFCARCFMKLMTEKFRQQCYEFLKSEAVNNE